MNINKDSFYKVVYNHEAFIVDGYELEEIFNCLNNVGRVIINDIGGGYYNAPYNENNTLSYQELYRIKYLELREVQE